MLRYVFILIFLLILGLPPVPKLPAAAQQASTTLVVLIFDRGCKTWCQKVRPMMKELKDQFGDRIDVAEIDASEENLKEAEVKAKSLGVYDFLRDSAEWVPIVGVFNARRKLVKELVGPKQKDAYVSAVQRALEVR